MDTVDSRLDAAAPLLEKQQAIERSFVETATSAGAITAHITKKTAHWSFIAEFIDTEKAALYAADLTNATRTVLSRVNLKATSSEPEN